MSYSVPCSTKILILAIAPFLIISVGVLCEFAMVRDVYIYILLSKKFLTHAPALLVCCS